MDYELVSMFREICFSGAWHRRRKVKMSIRRQLKRRYAPAFIQKLQACLVGMSGLLVGARHIIDNQGAVSRCKAIPKLRPEHIASSV
jgi:hypothetical protein